MKKLTKGFTLIELLVVIAIIGILSSVVLASLNTAREKARDARRISDLKNIQLALELYADTFSGNYPTTATVEADLADYLSTWPTPPAGAGAAYDYQNIGDTSYVLRAQLENSNVVLDSDIDADPGVTPADPDYCIDASLYYCITP